MTEIECEKCGRLMPQERLEVGLDKCSCCTNQEIPLVLMEFGHKTGGEPVIIRNKESQRQAWRVYRRER